MHEQLKKKLTKKTLAHQSLAAPPTKGQNRQVQIIEAAIKNFASVGIENTTPAKIAKTCKISRPLVLHYFKDVESIFFVAIKLIRAEFQQLAIEAIEKHKTPTDQLKAYAHSTLDWVEQKPDHVKVWLLFFYYCGLRREYKALNTELVNMGHDRIAALLELGLASKEFKFKDSQITAKAIQNVITGAVLCAMTEAHSPRLKNLRAETARICLVLAGAMA